ncbi:cinnamoyl-CoA reductase 1 isoform X1 [Sorghum bicolor]|uniref:cinnamoyl-CoA reductase 1 isoform X1 n=1 Tax=Sorghum bicolor TaxID=4558 RepID=UPI000B424C62|nr:cinnamoyl-CoA reductase 1 isoform X1 [Sorghum bicolor]|eukprot:XP_021312992.1 cinnamoyl-CoA reductase 1 isoform X1 [Sorghum bicolor]
MAAAGDAGGLLVCVTGASGFIGSWLVRCLLDRGYTVHATVKNLLARPAESFAAEDEGETKHLQAMGGADARLRLFQMDLVDPASVQPAIEGAHGVFHLASPMILQAEDPEKELLEPAVKGTLNVLRAAKDCGVGRVVLMSSQAAMVPNPNWPPGKVIDDDCWADVELLKKLQLWYSVSKTLAEKAAWDFAEKEELQIAVLNPGMVLGPMLTPSVNASLRLLLQILGGERIDLDDIYMGCVDVRDVAHSLIMLYENPSAQGRHLCMESAERLVDLANKIADLYPEHPVQRIREDKQGWVVRAKDPSKKLIKLGVRFTPLDKTIRDTVDCFRSKGLI